jgi:hypothetical protein
MTSNTAAPSTSAIAACLTKLVVTNMQPSNIPARIVLVAQRDINQIDRDKNHRLAKKSPRAKACGDFVGVATAGAISEPWP